MIKNDRWIKSKCMPPLASVSYLRSNGLGTLEHMANASITETHFRDSVKIYGDPFTNLDEAVKKEMDRIGAHPDGQIVSLTSDIEMEQFKPMIEPFLPMQVRTLGQDRHLKMLAMPSRTGAEALAKLGADFNGDHEFENSKIISKGLTSFGYDVSLSGEFAIFTNVNSAIIDPLNFDDEKTLHHVSSDDYVVLPPNSYLLCRTKEYFRIPRDVLVLCVGKSTYARCGAIVNVTPIEPGFEGNVVIEVSNSTNLPLKIYADQGIAQFLFFQSNEECETSYADRNEGKGGKYQGQTGITTARS